MLTFMDYVARSFGHSTGWNYDNSYSFLTETSDAILSFETPSSATLHASSLSTANFASSYTLSTLGQLQGSISYLYSNLRLDPPSKGPSIPLTSLVDGYRDVPLPVSLSDVPVPKIERKPTLLHATLLLPPPSTLTALYARRIRDDTLLSIFLNSKSVSVTTPGPPPASCLAHVQHDTGRYSIEALASTDSGLLGARGLWNFGIGKKDDEPDDISDIPGSVDWPFPPEKIDGLSAYYRKLTSKPSLLSAGAEVYYSPFSHVIGLSAGMRFTTLATHIRPANKPLAGTSAMTLLAPPNIAHSSFPYTMTMTINPIIGALASTYSVRATSNVALSSRFDFNVYSWESRYVLGAEIWRGRGRSHRSRKASISADDISVSDDLAWVNEKLNGWFSPEEQALKDQRMDRENENVIKLRVDDGFNIGCLWTGRVKSLIVSAGFSLSPVGATTGLLQREVSLDAEGRRKRWTGKFGLDIAYST